MIPLAAERSILKLNAERAGKRLAHWRQVLVSACEQCGRNRLPVISGVLSLDDYLDTRAGDVARLVLAPGDTEAIANVLRSAPTER